jgi:hypothetical protein
MNNCRPRSTFPLAIASAEAGWAGFISGAVAHPNRKNASKTIQQRLARFLGLLL